LTLVRHASSTAEVIASSSCAWQGANCISITRFFYFYYKMIKNICAFLHINEILSHSTINKRRNNINNII